MSWLHTWSGLLVGWVLFLVFSAGTAAYYREEISLWMKPELHTAFADLPSQAQMAAMAQGALEERSPDSRRWTIDMPTKLNSSLLVSFHALMKGTGGTEGRQRRGKSVTVMLGPMTGSEIDAPRKTRGGEFFARLHFDLYYISAIWGRWIVGFCAMSMLVAIITGVITHKRIFKDFFTFRPGKGQRSWLDAHNATAVLGLPYYLMITITGLTTFMFMYLPSGLQAAYPEQTSQFYSDLYDGRASDDKPATARAQLVPVGAVVSKARADWDGKDIGRIIVNNPGRTNATITVIQRQTRAIEHNLPILVFDGVTGVKIRAADGLTGDVAQARSVLYGLHMGRFAEPLVRALFFLSGLCGCAMVATGVLMWAVKERSRHLKARHGQIGIGLRLVDALNLGTIAGLVVAIPTYFWANRLLPASIANRADTEIACFFAAWAIAFLAAFAMPRRIMWRIQLSIGSLLFAFIPVLNPMTGGNGLTKSVEYGLWPVAGFDITSLLLGVVLLFAARRLRPNQAKQSKPALKAA